MSTFCYGLGFNLGTQTILYIYMTDVLNDTTSGIVGMFIWAFYGLFTLKGTPYAREDTWNDATFLMILFVDSLFGIAFMILLVPETKNKTKV